MKAETARSKILGECMCIFYLVTLFFVVLSRVPAIMSAIRVAQNTWIFWEIINKNKRQLGNAECWDDKNFRHAFRQLAHNCFINWPRVLLQCAIMSNVQLTDTSTFQNAKKCYNFNNCHQIGYFIYLRDNQTNFNSSN